MTGMALRARLPLIPLANLFLRFLRELRGSVLKKISGATYSFKSPGNDRIPR